MFTPGWCDDYVHADWCGADDDVCTTWEYCWVTGRSHNPTSQLPNMPRSKPAQRKSARRPSDPSDSDDTSVSPAKRVATGVTTPASPTSWDPAAFVSLIALPVPPDDLAAEVTVRKGQRCQAGALRRGSILYRYARIVVLAPPEPSGSARVRNQDLHAEGESADWNLDADLIDQQCWSPDQFTQTVNVTMTQMAAKIRDEVGDCVCKVEFTKLPDAAAMADLLRDGSRLIEASGLSDAEKKKLYKQLHARTQHGEYRIMRGYLLRSEDQQLKETDTGMIRFIDADLMAEGKHCERQVNVRTIKALTLKLTKYIVK